MNSRTRMLSILLVLSMLLPLGGAALAETDAQATPLDQTTAVDLALAWLRTQMQADGSFAPAFGSAAGLTADVVIGASAVGDNTSEWGLTTPLDYLEAEAEAYASSAATTGKLVIAVTAAGRDPLAFGGIDLRAKLSSYVLTDTITLGDNASDTSWGILGWAALGREIPQSFVDGLLSLQQADGGWESGPGFGTDSNTTALALQALNAANVAPSHDAVISAVSYMQAQQSPSGGFCYASAYGTDADANSSAYGIQGILAAGENPLAASWLESDSSALDDILTFQLSTGPDAGAFEWKMGQGANILTTAQALPALIGKTLPLPNRYSALSRGFDYLARQQARNGGVSSGFGDASAGTIMALAAADRSARGFASAEGHSVVEYAMARAAIHDDAGAVGRMAAALAMAGENPRCVGQANLILEVDDYYDAATGQYDVNGQVWSHCYAIWAMLATDTPVPPQAIQWLKDVQNADGGWGWAPGQTSDSNTTSLAVVTLRACDIGPIDAVFANTPALFHTWQTEDAGFVNNPQWGSAPDANSTAWAVGALKLLGQEPDSNWDWAKTVPMGEDDSMVIWFPTDRLYQFQLDDGAFEWQSGFGADVGATTDALLAIADRPIPYVSPNLTAAQRATDWLKAQQNADGSFTAGFGSDVSTTLDALFAGIAAGRTVASWSTGGSNPTLVEYLESECASYALDSGSIGKLVTGLVIAGQDPADFAGENWAAKLAEYDDGSGALSTSAPDQAWAMIGLAACKLPISRAAISHVVAFQQADGGFESGPEWGSDSNTTALVLQALAACNTDVDQSVIDSAVDYMLLQQSTTGGFVYSSVLGADPDANSTAYSMLGLIAIGEDVNGPNWETEMGQPMQDLLSFQIANGADAGALEWKPGEGANLLATAQGIPALLNETLPLWSVPTNPVVLPMLLDATVAK